MTIVRDMTICNERGLHARASARFVDCVNSYNAQVEVCRDGHSVGGDSIMGLLMLAAPCSTSITVSASGPEAQQCIDALTELVNSRFREQS